MKEMYVVVACRDGVGVQACIKKWQVMSPCIFIYDNAFRAACNHRNITGVGMYIMRTSDGWVSDTHLPNWKGTLGNSTCPPELLISLQPHHPVNANH